MVVVVVKHPCLILGFVTDIITVVLLLLLLLSSSSSLLLTAIQFSLGGSSPNTSADKTNKNKYT